MYFLKFSFRADRPRYDHFNGRDYLLESFQFSLQLYFGFDIYYHTTYLFNSYYILIHITYSLCFRILPIPLTFWLIDHTFTIRFYYSKIFIETIRIRFWIIASIHHIYHCLECCVAYLVYLLIYTYTIIIIIFQILYLHSFFPELWCVIELLRKQVKEKRLSLNCK